MRKSFSAASACALLFMLVCCNNPARQAALCYETAVRAFESGDYVSARQQIDSIRILYPTVIDIRREALVLEQRIDSVESIRTIAFEDSILSEARRNLESLLPLYKLEKDENYQDIGNYVIPSQNPENNISRSYLRAQVDEKGRLTLVSTYSGARHIHHTAIRVSDGEVFQESQPSDDCFEYDDLGVCYEKCNIHMENDPGVVSFIALNRDNDRLALTLVGETEEVKVKMTAADRKAVARIYDLSLLLLSIEEHQKRLDEARRRLQFVTSKMSLE